MQQHVFAISQTCNQLGIKHAVICPGSRSAPLVFAFTQNKDVNCISITDERSAAFIALGMAKQLQQPVVLICTSGTAALNFYPAIAEAFYQKIPLIVLTADRPPEFLNQQDGQMITQKNVFEKNILASFELPCYVHGKENLQETSNTILTAIGISNGFIKGPVHINVPLREPLYPTAKKTFSFHSTLLTTAPPHPLTPSPFLPLKKAWLKSEKKVILIGELPINNGLFTTLFELSKNNDVVILCDVLSNKQSVCTAPHFDFIVSQSDEKTLLELEPDLIISFGGSVLSKAVKLWLKKQKPKHHFRIQQQNELVNTYNNVTAFIKSNPEIVLKELVEKKEDTTQQNNYKLLWKKIDELAAFRISHFIKLNSFSELQATNIILNNLPDACNFHIANSSVIRYVSLLGNLKPSWQMSGNRGTSGIDGSTSTAVGAALINNKPTVLLTGDLAFLYDRNALWNHCVSNNLRIIVFNNYGGGIFTLIDGPSSVKEQLNYFTTPHRQSIKNTVLDNGLGYYFCDSENELKKAIKIFFDLAKKAAVLEITFNLQENAKVFKSFKKIKLI